MSSPRERIRHFGGTAEAGPGRLLGVVAAPADGPRDGLPAVLLFNAGIVHRIGPHRLNVKLARRLCARGLASIRFDIAGLGDSAPADSLLSYEAQAVVDIRAAADALASDFSAQEFVAIGMCSGADNAYRVALADPRIKALVLLDPYAYGTQRAKIDRTLEKVRDLGRWRRAIGRTLKIGDDRDAPEPGAPAFRDAEGDFAGEGDNHRVAPPLETFGRDLKSLTDRGVRILIRYTTYVEETLTNVRHFHEAFRDFDFGGNLAVDVDRTVDHTYARLPAQAELFSRIELWLEERWPASGERDVVKVHRQASA